MLNQRKETRSSFRPATFEDINRREKEPVKKFDERDFTAEAEALRKKVVAEALEEARAQASLIERDAYEQGFKKGEEAGQRVVLQQLSPFLTNFEALTGELARLRELHLGALEKELLPLGVEIARRVVHAELKLAPEKIAGIARAAIANTVDRERIVIRVSAADRDFLEQYRPDLLTVEGVKEVRIESDPRIEGGGCIVETTSGEVDATIPTQLHRFEALTEPAE